MAKFQVRLTEDEVEEILLATVRKKFNIDPKTTLKLDWADVADTSVTISTPNEPLEGKSWLDED